MCIISPWLRLTLYQYDTETKILVYFCQYTKTCRKLNSWRATLSHLLLVSTRRWIILAIHFPTSQSARARSSIYLCGELKLTSQFNKINEVISQFHFTGSTCNSSDYYFHPVFVYITNREVNTSAGDRLRHNWINFIKCSQTLNFKKSRSHYFTFSLWNISTFHQLWSWTPKTFRYIFRSMPTILCRMCFTLQQ